MYSYINTSGNWENEKLCGNTTPEELVHKSIYKKEKPIKTKLRATFGFKVTPDEFEKFEAAWTV